MGDMLTLIERAQQTFDQQQVEQLQKKIRTASLDLNDFLAQLQQLRRMGPLEQLLDLIPGMSHLVRSQAVTISEKDLKRIEAIIQSMTPEERAHPEIIGASRKRRIARGSGTTPADMDAIARGSRYVLGRSAGAGDLGPMTALGVLRGLRVALRHRLGSDRLEGVRVAVQGLGAVGMPLATFLAEAGARLLVSDLDPAKLANAVDRLGARPVPPEAILSAVEAA